MTACKKNKKDLRCIRYEVNGTRWRSCQTADSAVSSIECLISVNSAEQSSWEAESHWANNEVP
jgi:hypothetical protein